MCEFTHVLMRQYKNNQNDWRKGVIAHPGVVWRECNFIIPLYDCSMWKCLPARLGLAYYLLFDPEVIFFDSDFNEFSSCRSPPVDNCLWADVCAAGPIVNPTSRRYPQPRRTNLGFPIRLCIVPCRYSFACFIATL